MTERFLLAALAAAVAIPAIAAEKLDAGPRPETSYVTTAHAAQRFESKDGRVAVQQDNVVTLSCAKCKTPRQLPGMVYHAYNNSKKPVCFMLDMAPEEARGDRLVEWGANRAHYLKPGDWYYKIAGLTQSMGNVDSANLAWRGGIRVWDPVGANSCAAPPR
ncbi:hypothetical protein [Sphingopyxis sp. KK2]|uniref:hypothetical protein n=1 Tax=Sphingopyxis sp. KK2 TaxID=1855727 RepID=UPI00097E58F5|nr:hypothetical protein [Sphingopyxis sp. KK2]